MKALIAVSRDLLIGSEQELQRLRDRFALLKSELERSKGDNVKLFEKIRYVAEYTRESRLGSRLGKKVRGWGKGGAVRHVCSAL